MTSDYHPNRPYKNIKNNNVNNVPEINIHKSLRAINLILLRFNFTLMMGGTNLGHLTEITTCQ